jgi:hypothetical protein
VSERDGSERDVSEPGVGRRGAGGQGVSGRGPAAGRPAAEWLARCEPAPPPALAARVAALLGDAPFASADDAVDRCVASAERVVAGLLRDGCTSRDSALDLLAADALATYAFELAGDRPDTLGALAEGAMRRFAALGVGDVTAGQPGGAGPEAVPAPAGD